VTLHGSAPSFSFRTWELKSVNFFDLNGYSRPTAERLRPRSLARVVLVVDDEPLILDLTSSMLEDLGCEVVTADCGTHALEKLATNGRTDEFRPYAQQPRRFVN
jgi:hypothetical protein